MIGQSSYFSGPVHLRWSQDPFDTSTGQPHRRLESRRNFFNKDQVDRRWKPDHRWPFNSHNHCHGSRVRIRPGVSSELVALVQAMPGTEEFQRKSDGRNFVGQLNQKQSRWRWTFLGFLKQIWVGNGLSSFLYNIKNIFLIIKIKWRGDILLFYLLVIVSGSITFWRSDIPVD